MTTKIVHRSEMASSLSRSGSDENYKVKCAYGEKGENNVREFHSDDQRVVSAELFEGQARRICTLKGVNANYSHGNGSNAKGMNGTALQRCQMLNSEYMSTSFSDLEKRCVNMYLHTTRSCDTSGKRKNLTCGYIGYSSVAHNILHVSYGRKVANFITLNYFNLDN